MPVAGVVVEPNKDLLAVELPPKRPVEVGVEEPWVVAVVEPKRLPLPAVAAGVVDEAPADVVAVLLPNRLGVPAGVELPAAEVEVLPNRLPLGLLALPNRLGPDEELVLWPKSEVAGVPAGVVLDVLPKRLVFWPVVAPPNRLPDCVPDVLPNEKAGVLEPVVLPKRPPLAGAVDVLDWPEAPLVDG